MKIIIMGTGGVGGYFGARLKNAGHDVAFIARGEHLNAQEKEFIKNYNSRKYIHNGIDYTQQMRAMSFSPGMR